MYVKSARSKWHDRWVSMAELVASWSKDPSTKVGAVVVEPGSQVVKSTGWNGFPRGVAETEAALRGEEYGDKLIDDRWEKRPEKYEWVEHAERNAIYNAARHGISLNGCVMYLNWAPTPCADCARAIIQAGIVAVIGPDKPFTGVGTGVHYDCDDISQTMLREAGIITRAL